MAVKLNQHDLEFILKQIKIAEAHARGIPLNEVRVDQNGDYGTEGMLAISQPHLPYGLRTVDGTYNNIIPGRELWGAADQTMPRMFDPYWRAETDSDQMHFGNPAALPPGAPAAVTNNDYGVHGSPTSTPNPMDNEVNGGHTGSVADADPRIISNLIVDQSPNNPAAIIAALRYAGIEGDLSVAVAAIASPYKLIYAEEQAQNRAEARAGLLAAAEAKLPAAQAAYAADNSAVNLTNLTAAENAVSGAEAALGIAEGILADVQASIANFSATIDGVTYTMPEAALDAAAAFYGVEFEMDGTSIKLPNVAPDEGLSAPFNGWMTFFGQFFDHGLDLISKGGNGTIYVPLQPDDPLYVPGGHTNFMVLTRATQVPGPGADGLLGTSDDTIRESINTTTPFVDQNQTYTSHPSHQVFLREYAMVWDAQRGRDVPLATGRLLDGQNGGLPTWADVKEQARDKLGIALTDKDVFNIPLIRTDLYGEFIRDANGFPQVIVDIGADGIPNTDDDLVASGTNSDPLTLRRFGEPEDYVDPDTGETIHIGDVVPVRTSHSFLDDIAHNAVPVITTDGILVTDNVIIGTVDPAGNAVQFDPLTGSNTEYDNELLDKHFITGDGRGNENIGLTAVHHVFHSEHNRQVDVQKLEILKSKDVAFINEWLSVDLVQLTAAQLNAINGGGVSLALLAGTITLAELSPAQLASVQAAGVNPADLLPPLSWDGERLFQAARFSTEMQYQHLVFEEFGRKVQPLIDVFVFNTQTDIDPAIFSEFANVVYRFGHSMLTEDIARLFLNDEGAPVHYVPRLNEDGEPELDESGKQIIDEVSVTLPTWNQDIGLIEAFLNPMEFDQDGTITHEQAAGAIFRGMTLVRGNEIDEFVVDALRTNLLGLPLDLAAINIARGRDTGMPTLNQAREQLYDATNSTFVKPYESWSELAANLKNPASVINFIAAYGKHPSLLAVQNGTVEQMRDAATLLVLGGPGAPADRLAFLNSTGAWTAANSGLNEIDLWVGGLAEKKMPFGGMLGSTFNAVFEAQLEMLQDFDRFYYLTRTQGLNLLNELENNAFSKMVAINSDMVDPGLDGIRGTDDDIESPFRTGVDPFAKHDFVLNVDLTKQIEQDPEHDDAHLNAIGMTKVQRDNLLTADDPLTENVNEGADANYIRFIGGEHVVIGGSEGNDTIVSDFGDDAIWGGGGDDRIESGAGVDFVIGGAGNDIITDSGDTGDFIKGEDGDDIIANSNGLDVLMGGDGKDVFFVGVDATEVFAGEGDDFILGGADHDFLLGNEGSDWMEGGDGFDVLNGDNSELFFNSTIIGHDVAFAGENENDFDMESGDDIMVQGESVMRNEGMFGFDWAIHKGNRIAADSDMRIPIFTTVADDILRDRFDQTEALSGWVHNDVLRGDDRGSKEEIEVELDMTKHELSWAGVDRIHGLEELMDRVLLARPTGNDPATGKPWDLEKAVAFAAGNVLIGGDGNDTFEGRGGDDFIHGDAWLNVRIRITAPVLDEAGKVIGALPNDAEGANEIATVDTLKHVFTEEQVEAWVAEMGLADTDPLTQHMQTWVGQSMFDLMIARTIVPAQMHIHREILYDENPADNVDTAIFAGNSDWYEITQFEDGSVRVARREMEEVDPQIDEGVDTLVGIERLQFANETIVLQQSGNHEPVGRIVIDGLPAKEGEALSIDASQVYDANNPGEVGQGNTGHMTFRWQIERNDGTGDYINIPGAFGTTFTPNDEHTGLRIRVVGTYVDAGGVTETVMSLPTDLVIGVNDDPVGPLLISDPTPTEGQVLTATVAFTDADGITDAFEEGLLTYQWQYSENNGTSWLNATDPSPTPEYTPTAGRIGDVLRVQVVYTDDLGNVHTVNSAPTSIVGDNISSPSGNATNGTNGSDIINGDNDGESLSGGLGNDVINGNGGTDTINGGDGNDVLNGGTNSNAGISASFADNFDGARSYSGNDGSRDFTDDWVETGDDESATGGQIRISAGSSNSRTLQFGDNGDGAAIHRVINLAGATSATISYDYVESSFDSGETVVVEFSPDGSEANFQTVQTINNASGNNDINDAPLIGPFTADAVIRFRVQGTNNSSSSDLVTINNLVINASFPGGETINGGAGDDLITYRSGDDDDNIDGGADTDTVSFIGGAGNSSDSITITLVGSTITKGEWSNGDDADIVNVEHFDMDLGGGTDTLSYAGNAGAVEVDLLTGAATGFNWIRNVENVTGGSGSDTIHGDNNANVLQGGAGAASDTLRGGFGDDNISGGEGDDLLYGDEEDDVINGGLGDDRIDGGDGNDTASYAGATTGVTVTLNQTATTVAAALTTGVTGKDLFVSIENLFGSIHSDSLTGDAGANILDGGGSGSGGNTADLMIGLGGDDTYIVDDTTAAGGVDQVFEATDGGNDTVRSSVALNLLTGVGFAGQEIENIVLTGTSNIAATGNAEDNHIAGNTGANAIDGGDGDDTIVLAGRHELHTFGRNGNDTLTTVSSAGDAGSDTLTSIEFAEIDETSYRIVAGTNGAANTLGAAVGENSLLLGFNGNDVLNGNSGHDILKGGDGNDTLDGGAGNDILDGGASGGSTATASHDFQSSSQTGGSGWSAGWTESDDNNGTNSATAGQIRIDSGSPSNRLVLRDDGNGASIMRTLDLTGRTSASISYDYQENSFDAGETVIVQFRPSASGSWQTVQTINGSSGSGDIDNFVLNGPFGADAAIRVTVSGTNANSGSNNPGDWVSIDNLVITAVTAGGDVMSGGDGNDTYYVDGTSGSNIDLVNEGSGINSGTDTVIFTANGNYTLAANVENLIARSAGTRTLTGNGGDNEITGGTGNDRIDGAGGIDTAIYANPVTAYTIGANNAGELTIGGGTGVGTDTLVGIEKIRFGTNTVTINTQATGGNDAITVSGTDGQIIMGGGGNDTIIGGDGHDIIVGGAGDDALFGSDVGTEGDNATTGANDNDTFIWNVGDGSDAINGGFEGTEGDLLVINGSNGSETYRIYTIDEAIARIAYEDGDVGGDFEAEIVITRQTSGGDEVVIAAMTDIEEIVINGNAIFESGSLGGGDTVQMFGDFSLTSLRPETITVTGGSGNDTVDISSLLSAHRIVFKTGGGNDVIVGTLRPQDVVVLPDGGTIADYDVVENANGTTTVTSGTHSVTFHSPSGLPQFGSDDDHDDDEDEGTPNNPDPVDPDPTDPDPTDPDPTDPDPVDPDEDDDEDEEDEDEDDEDEDEDGHDETAVPGVGTAGNDVLVGNGAADYLIGFNGDDVMIGHGGADVIIGGLGDDFLSGLVGSDTLWGDAGSDTVLGGDDADMVYGGEGDDRLFADGGNDLVTAGSGNDVVVGGTGNDRFVAEIGDGNDSYFGDEMTGGTGVDTLYMSSISANATVDLGSGLQGLGSASSSQTGTDMLWNIENVVTGSGNDRITASDSVNVMDGGTGDDTFIFKSIAAANGDTILGFETGDKLDLSNIDADNGAFGRQSFTLTNSAIDSIRDLQVTHETRADGEYTVVAGNVSGGVTPEFKISIKGTHTLTENDFLL